MESQKIHPHQLSADALAAKLQVDVQRGLSEAEAQRRLKQHGANRLTPQRGKSPWRLLFEQVHQPLVYILLIAAAVTGFLQEWVDSSVIFGVVLVNTLIGFIQEANALKAIDALSRVLTVTSTVLRDGQRRSIAATELTIGDVVLLQSGDKVPADLRLLQIRELQIDESALTGESVPVEKSLAILSNATVLADRTNMAYASALVTYGSGLGVVVDIGDHTEIGRINSLLSRTVELETPLTKKMGQFSTLLLWVILGLAAVTFAVGVWRGQPLLEMFMAAVALAVGAIPEGLPAALTITLAIGVSRMAKSNAIIRKLPAVETLGSTTVICSDKTGTLTQNQMTVQSLYAGGALFGFTGSGYTPEGDIYLNNTAVAHSHYPVLMECLKAGLLCNDARLIADVNTWRIEGDPTEGALLVSAHKAGLHQATVSLANPRLDAIPFESQHQFMATLHHNQALDVRQVYLKGALESILARCDKAFDLHMQPMALDKALLQQQVEQLAAQGLRVLKY
ncbi:MAG: HAD-IC family P-type ATPase [Methylococcaceae bacterium]|nr:HAD-IC family P-type ATPase [Methylococcaceae bacterium]